MHDTIKSNDQNSEAITQAEKITELLKDEQYIYQGKVYSYKSLYKTSSLKTIIFVVYGTVVLVGVFGVVWWTYLKPIGIGTDIRLPSFLLGETESAPTVRVRPPVEKPIEPEIKADEEVVSLVVSTTTATTTITTTNTAATTSISISTSTTNTAATTSTSTSTTTTPAL